MMDYNKEAERLLKEAEKYHAGSAKANLIAAAHVYAMLWDTMQNRLRS